MYGETQKYVICFSSGRTTKGDRGGEVKPPKSLRKEQLFNKGKGIVGDGWGEV